MVYGLGSSTFLPDPISLGQNWKNRISRKVEINAWVKGLSSRQIGLRDEQVMVHMTEFETTLVQFTGHSRNFAQEDTVVLNDKRRERTDDCGHENVAERIGNFDET